MKKFELITHISTALTSIVAGITIYSWITNDDIKSVDDVVTAIDNIAIQIRETGLSVSSVDQTDAISLALTDLALSTTQNQSQILANGSGYLRVNFGLFSLNRNQAIDLEASNGDFRSFGFVGFTNGNINYGASVNFGGDHESHFQPGEVLRFEAGDETCEVTPISLTDSDDGASAQFRYRCR